jgi:hypothetical protein
MEWAYNTTQQAYLYSPILKNINLSITSDPVYYNLIKESKITCNTSGLIIYLQNKLNDIKNAYLLDNPELTLVISLEDENGLWIDTTTDSTSNCTLNTLINQLNTEPLKNEYSYNSNGNISPISFMNGLGVNSWIGYFNNSGPLSFPHFRLGVTLLWFHVNI